MAALREQYGWNELPEKKKSKWVLLLLAFTGPMPMLIWIGIIVELSVGVQKLAQATHSMFEIQLFDFK